jgi:hypothetical protein
MIRPTINDRPFRYVRVLYFSSDPPPSPPLALPVVVDAPIGAYPASAVEERGKRLAEKSNADETEYERPWRLDRALAAGFAESRGSSCSRDALREEDMLGRESVSAVFSPGLELASDASSRESRGWFWRLE